MNTVVTTQADQERRTHEIHNPNLEVVIYSHSGIIYWWPVWAVGAICAILTAIGGQPFAFGKASVYVHPNPSLGVIFTLTFLLVIVMTHITVRGVASLTVIMSIIAFTLFLAYFGWWDNVMSMLGKLAIFMNLGFYVFFSTAIFIVWALGVFVFDRLEYWVFRPGQAIHHTVLGGGEHTYDTRGMVVEKKRDDLFRHWILGLGSGDLQLATTGAKKIEAVVANVMFIDAKLNRIKALAAMRPDEDPQLAPPPPDADPV